MLAIDVLLVVFILAYKHTWIFRHVADATLDDQLARRLTRCTWSSWQSDYATGRSRKTGRCRGAGLDRLSGSPLARIVTHRRLQKDPREIAHRCSHERATWRSRTRIALRSKCWRSTDHQHHLPHFPHGARSLVSRRAVVLNARLASSSRDSSRTSLRALLEIVTLPQRAHAPEQHAERVATRRDRDLQHPRRQADVAERHPPTGSLQQSRA